MGGVPQIGLTFKNATLAINNLYKIWRPYVKWFSRECANRQTDTHTHGWLRFYNF